MKLSKITTSKIILGADVATAGTFVVGYPAGYNGGHYSPAGHRISAVNGGDFVFSRDFTVVFGATAATITWRNAATLKAGTELIVQFAKAGVRDDVDPTTIDNLAGARVMQAPIVKLNLGNPIAGAATQVTTAQLLAQAGNLALDGALAVNGIVTADVPRNVTLTVATTNQSAINFTIYGRDEFGNPMVETIAGPNANTVQGNKAFKVVTRVAASAAIATNGVSVGFGNKLGLPVFLSNSTFILRELEGGAVAVAGTVVAGVTTTPTATTGDVRGTYTPNSTPDGIKAFSLLVALENAYLRGAPQFAG